MQLHDILQLRTSVIHFLFGTIYAIFSIHTLHQKHSFSNPSSVNSSQTHVRLVAWFWSAQADIFFSESLHSTLRSGRRKTIVSQTMCALAEHLCKQK